jgi:hypothetical protein
VIFGVRGIELATDLGSTQNLPLKTVEIHCACSNLQYQPASEKRTISYDPVQTTHMLLQSSRMDHHGNRPVGVKVRLAIQARQPQQGALRVINAAPTDQPTGRLRGQGDADQKRHRPHPLQRVGDTVRPLIGAAQLRLDDADTDDLTKAPAEFHIGRQVAAQRNRAYFRCVGDGNYGRFSSVQGQISGRERIKEI